MNKFVVAILACVAGSAFADYMVRDASGVMIDVPKDGGYVVEFNPYEVIPESDESSEFQPLPDFDEVEYTVYYYYLHQGRTIDVTLYIDNEAKKTSALTGNEVCKDSFKLSETDPKPQSIAFTVHGSCTSGSCVNTITIIFWARLKKNGEYLRQFTPESPMPLYYRAYSPMFDLEKASVHNFVYNANSEQFLFVYKHHDYVSDAVVKFNEGKSYASQMTGIFKNVTFMEGTNTISVHGTGHEENVYLEMGAFESAAPAIKAISFVLLALCALLF